MNDETKIPTPKEIMDYIDSGTRTINTQAAIDEYNRNKKKRYFVQTNNLIRNEFYRFTIEAKNLHELDTIIDERIQSDEPDCYPWEYKIEILAVEEIEE